MTVLSLKGEAGPSRIDRLYHAIRSRGPSHVDRLCHAIRSHGPSHVDRLCCAVSSLELSSHSILLDKFKYTEEFKEFLHLMPIS